MRKLGITSGELRKTPEGGIEDLNIAINLIRYAFTYDDSEIIKKIKPELVREALIEYFERK